MAFEVARVHGLIRSNIGDDGLPLVFSPPNFGSMHLPEYPSFLSEFGYDGTPIGQWPDMSGSPIEMSACSTETESDEDDEFLAGLAEQIAHSMLEDDDGSSLKSVSPAVNWSNSVQISLESDFQKVAGSPPSSWSSGSWVSASSSSSKSSSRVSSQVSSPPSTPLSAQNNAWDLLYAAAGEVVRQKTNERRAMSFQARVQQQQAQQAQQRAQVQWTQHLHSQLPGAHGAGKGSHRVYPVSTNVVCSPSTPVHSGDRCLQGLPQMQRGCGSRVKEDVFKFPSSQNPLSKGPQTGGWVRQNRSQPLQAQQASRLGNRGGHCHQKSGRSAECNSLHRHNIPPVTGGSGMRAVFLGGSGSGRESGGTGVFLPRTVGSGGDVKRKPACSTVLLPTRIVQVLNLNVEDMRTNATSPCTHPHSHGTRQDYLPSPSSSCLLGTSPIASPKMCHEESWASPYRKSHLSSRQNPASEITLPTEWTY